MKTKVLFLIDKFEDEKGEVFAFFPEENGYFNSPDMKQSYSHIGQHTPCSIEYANECDKAICAQYADLKQELEGIGYELEILN